MVCFPNAKINLGLQVTLKRTDGFHNLRTVMYPLPFYDILEFKESSDFSLAVWGRVIPGSMENNLIHKAWKLAQTKYNIPPQEIHLLKNIPPGSGLGGGSANATFFIKELLKQYKININQKELLKLTTELCSDCSFFSINKPAYVIGKGNIVEPLEFSLAGYYLLIIFPQHPISTGEAFKSIEPKAPEYNLKKLILEKDFKKWRTALKNDFEQILTTEQLSIKNTLYQIGAIYASLTGSGSAFYGLFIERPTNNLLLKTGLQYKLFHL